MKTDQPIYLYLNAGLEAFRVQTGGLTLDGPYRFASITPKGLETFWHRMSGYGAR